MNTSTIFTIALFAVIGISMSACNTVAGVGQDLEHASESVQEAAQ